MNSILVRSRLRKIVAGASLALTGASAFAEGGATTGFDLTSVGTAVTEIATAIQSFITGTMIGKVALIAGAFLALRLTWKFIRYLAGR